MATKTKATARASGKFQCCECGWECPKWVGRCGECHAWGSISEAAEAQAGPRTVATRLHKKAEPIATVSTTDSQPIPTGLTEFDRVLGGGLVPGAVALLAGEPGVGKSTLLLEVAARFAGSNPLLAYRPVLYLTGEESAAQVRCRAERVGALTDNLYLAAETDLGQVLGQIETLKPALVIVDSVQTIASTAVEGVPGGVAQVREVAAALISAAKAGDHTVILVGHVTKDGTVAGPRTLEHLVDVVLQFDAGESGLSGGGVSGLRLLRASKNRYGPTDEVGCFELSGKGLAGLTDPSGRFVSHRETPPAGTAVTVTLEGRRPLALEIQALVAPAGGGNPRRAVSGFESARLSLLLAVLHRHCDLKVSDQEVCLSTVGGVRLTGPAGDLAAALAITSTFVDMALPPGLIAVGEVGLAGDIRSVPGLSRRLLEAERLGFTTALVASGGGAKHQRRDSTLGVIEVASVSEALQLLFFQQPEIRGLKMVA
ncbi:MAG: DNA repair protein RadA [Promicromonosporaceae bacterium]|nr:DNA repair protein RadA [Promicromonosporaceae bacterium]